MGPTWRIPTLATIGVLVIAAPLAAGSHWYGRDRAELGPYHLQAVRDDAIGGERLAITRDGMAVTVPADGPLSGRSITILSENEVIDGNRRGVLIQRSWPLDAHSDGGTEGWNHDYALVVLDGSGEPRIATTFFTGTQPASVQELDSRPGLELVVDDDALAHFESGDTALLLPGEDRAERVCFQWRDEECAFWPVSVILRYKDGAYWLADDQMRSPPWDETDVARRTTAIRNSTLWRLPGRHIPFQLATDMAALIYSGNASQAMRYLDAAWPAGRDGRDTFLHDLYDCRIRQSRYWPQIAALNGLSPGVPDAPGCPPRGDLANPYAWFQGAFTVGRLIFKLFAATSQTTSFHLSLDAFRGDEPIAEAEGLFSGITGRWIRIHREGPGLLGDSRDIVVIEQEEGGNARFYRTILLDVTEGLPREVTEIYTGRGGPGVFVDLDGRPGKEFETTDGIFNDASFTGEPPPVRLRFRDGAYGIDTDLMRAPPLDAAELAAAAAMLRMDLAWQHHGEYGALPEDLWPTLARLIYTGHAHLALQLVDLAWPRAIPGKDDFLRSFYRCKLRESQYWPAIAAMNDLPADPPDCSQ